MNNSFTDGIRSFVSSLTNSRAATAQNYMTAQRLNVEEMRAIYRTGLGSKIIRLKAGAALNNTLQFESTPDETYYTEALATSVKRAARWMVAFGRGIIVVHHRGDELSEPLQRTVDPGRVLLSVFSGDMVTTMSHETDLQSPRYYKPTLYNVRGRSIHYSRVVDFTYVEPPEMNAPQYFYGGIGEFELIYEQIIADGVVQRASPKIVDKASTLFYRVKGFKDAMRTGREGPMLEYFRRLEDVRGLHSAGLIDDEDSLEVVSQTLTNLSDADRITLRRLAMVTGIPLALLIGENVQGLNSTGDNEMEAYQDMVETFQSDYLLSPINRLAGMCGLGRVDFVDNQGETPSIRIDYETKASDNALKLAQLGEDYSGYLVEKGVTQPDDFSSVFGDGEA